MNKPFRTLASRIVFQNPWYRIRQDDVLLANGQPSVYNVIELAGAVWIVPLLADGRIALIRQYRYAIDDWCLEIPAGGMGQETDPRQSAERELKEEVGGVAAEWHFLGRYWTMKGVGNEAGYFFLARGVVLGTPQHEATELIEPHIVSVDEALALARSGEMADAPSAFALLLSESLLR